MELSDVMSFGDRTALKFRFGWDTVEKRRMKRYKHVPETVTWDCCPFIYILYEGFCIISIFLLLTTSSHVAKLEEKNILLLLHIMPNLQDTSKVEH